MAVQIPDQEEFTLEEVANLLGCIVSRVLHDPSQAPDIERLPKLAVLPVVGEFEAAGMAKHVRMHREFDSGFPTSSGYYSPH